MNIDFKALLQGLGQMGANTINAHQGRPLQQFAPINESENKWFVKDKPQVLEAGGYLPDLAPANPYGGSEDSYGGVRAITQPGAGTSAGSSLMNLTDPQMMFRRRANMVAGNPLSFIGQALSNLGNGRRFGGDINANEPYVVGEEGAEIIVPEKKGKVIPNPVVQALLSAAMEGGTQQSPPSNTTFVGLPPLRSDGSPMIGWDGRTTDNTNIPQQQQQQQTVSPLDIKLGDAQREYEKRIGEDPKALNKGKGAVWRDALIKGLQIFSNVMNPNNQVPIQGWGAQRKQLHVNKAANVLAPLQKMKEVQLQRDAKQAQINTIATDDERQAKELARKIEKDAATVAYWNRKADQNDLKIANDTELMMLRDKWATSKDKNDVRRLDLVEKEIRERTARNNASIASREKIAGLSQAAQDRRQAIAIEAQRVAAEIRAAQTSKQKDKELAARERLEKLKREDDDIVGSLGFTPTP